MSKRIYISADYDSTSGDKNVVDELNRWGRDNKHSTDFVDMAKVISGSVSLNNNDCRPCELKAEFNRQINSSSIVVFVVGDKTATRASGSSCGRANYSSFPTCTPYKQNTNGQKFCHYKYLYQDGGDVNVINNYSYLRHEFEQAKKRGKTIVILYNSTRYETSWLPSYMRGYENNAIPFWTTDVYGYKVGNYYQIKRALGYV